MPMKVTEPDFASEEPICDKAEERRQPKSSAVPEADSD